MSIGSFLGLHVTYYYNVIWDAFWGQTGVLHKVPRCPLIRPPLGVLRMELRRRTGDGPRSASELQTRSPPILKHTVYNIYILYNICLYIERGA